jgi:hypothetical protein
MDPGAHAMTDGQSLAALEQEISQTRAKLTLTISALEDKLTPRHLVKKGFDMVNDGIGGTEGLNRGLATIRANPVPFALIAFGAAWLVTANSGITERIAQDERVRAAKRRAGEYASDMARRAGIVSDDRDRPLGETGHPLVDAGTERSGASGWVHRATGVTGEAIGSVRDSGGALMAAVERNPLIVGGLGLFAGAVLAMLLPATRTENAWLGSMRDSFWRRAEQAGHEAAAAVRTIAQNAAAAAADAAAEAAKNAGAGPAQG